MTKRCISILIAVACLLSLFAFWGLGSVEVQAAADIPDILLYEKNSSSKAFRISTNQGLKKFSELGQNTNFSGVSFYLVADIDMSGVAYTPVPAFSGTFDGGYHVIERLSVTTTNKNCALIGTVNAAGVIRRLGLEGCSFHITSDHSDYRVGSFAGVVRGLVDECWSSSVLTATASGTVTDLSVGGIAGALLGGGIVQNSFFAGHATGVDHAAGIADWCQGQYEGYVGQIINCYSIGLLNAKTCYALGRYSGKILAEHKPNAIINSYYFDDHTTYDWASEAVKLSKSVLGSGYLAYLLNSTDAVWSKGAMFPELRGEGKVYSLKVTYNNKSYSSTSTMYYNAGDTYTVNVPSGTSVSLSASAGTVSGNTLTMPAKNTILTVTVDLPNIAQFTTYPNASVYAVTNTAGFTAMATAVNGGKTLSGKSIYMLGDIDMNNVNHTPIGQFVSDTSWTKSFSGTFYGNNFKVFNLKVNQTSLNGGGLFGSSYKATFVGLHIFNGSVTVANRGGGITGYADGGCTFRYCSNGADIKTTTGVDGAGGLAGVARGGCLFEYCANYGTVTAATKAAAGIAGWGQTNIKLNGCINTGIISAPQDVAALARVGSGFSGTWSDCYYLKSACSTSVSGSSKDESNFCTGIIGGSINTVSRTVANKGAYTNTPRFPAICTENEATATCTRLSAYDSGVYIGYVTVYANVGDLVAMTGSQDYYSTEGHAVTAELTNRCDPAAVPYGISLVLNGGSLNITAPASYSYLIGAALPLSTQIQKSGYVFAGWYDNSAFSGQVYAVVGPKVRGNKTFYAKWSTLVEISTVDQYLSFVNGVNGGDSYSNKVVRITADLNFGGKTIPPLGTKNAPFCGVLDGQGNTFSNFTVSGTDAQGLVGYLKQGTVQYIKVENATVSGKTNVGSVVGYNDGGLVLGCESSAKVVNTASIYDLSYMSFNIRCGEDPSPNTVAERTPRVKTYLAKYVPDIIGLQEVTPTWKTVLASALSGYSMEFTYRGSSNQEAAPLYWKTSKFNALEQGTFWLSPTPDKISYGWGAKYYRTCSYAVLQPKNTNIIILAYNTHLDHQSVEAQNEGIKLVKSRIDAMETKYRNKGYTEIYSVVTGDFNAKPGSVAVNYLAQTMSEARNIAVSLGTPVGQNSFSAYNASPSSLIDYIFVSRNMDVKTYKVTLDKVDGKAISDHYGLYGTLRLGGNTHGGIVGYNKGNIQSCGFTGSMDTTAGCGGVAGMNPGYIVNSYGQFTGKTTDVFTNGITSKAWPNVFFSYYANNMGLSGAGSAASSLTNSSYLTNLNRPLKQWSMKSSVNNGLPFICIKHQYVYTSSGSSTHTGKCSLCSATISESHSAVTDGAVAPSCIATGLTQGSHCGKCNYVIVAQEKISATGHSYTYKASKNPTVSATGTLTGTCSRCSGTTTVTLPKLNSTDYTKSTIKTPTCTETGTDSYKWNTTTYGTFTFTATAKALGHSYTEKVTAPTCTAQGYTTYTCSRCSSSYKDNYINAKGHTEVIDKAMAATCTASGKTEGKHCSVCNAVLVKQETVAALGHSYITNVTAPTCTAQGYTTYTCSRCSHSYNDNYVNAKGHTEVIDKAVAATCTTSGKTEGKHCSVCNAVLVKQETVAALGHSYIEKVTAPTCTVQGYTTYTCSRCSHSYKDNYVAAKGHTEVIDKAVTATCTTSGKTEGKHCSVCNTVLTAQEAVPATGHTEVTDQAVPASCTEDGLTEGRHCEVCGEALLEQETVPATGHSDTTPADNRCDICGERIKEAVLRFRTISLKGNIAINYYMDLSDEVAADESAYMLFTMEDGEQIKVPASEGEYSLYQKAYYYSFSCAVSAKEMTDTVICQFFWAGGQTEAYTYSVKTYADRILASNSSAKLRELIYAMLNYGAASQIHFEYHTERLANAGQVVPDYTQITVEGFPVNSKQGTTLATYAGASLLLTSETTLRIFFTVDSRIADRFTVSYKGETLPLGLRSGKYYADIPDISAKDLDEYFTLTITDGTETAEVSYAPLSYCASIIENAKGIHDRELQDVAAAMYLYNLAANAYFAK